MISARAFSAMNNPVIITKTPNWPLSINTNPMPTRPQPSTRPALPASRIARYLSPVRDQRIARRTRPPSRGAPGSMLNTARTPLTKPTQMSTVDCNPMPAAKVTRPIRRLTAGPASAMRPSARGLGDSRSRRATPPSAQRSIDSVRTPYRRATSAWPNSCARIEAKKATVARTPPTMPRSTDRTTPNHTAMIAMLQCARTGMPA